MLFDFDYMSTFNFIFSVFTISCAVILIFNGLYKIIFGLWSKSWPTAEGKVSFLDYKTTQKYYIPKMKYEYMVQNKKYISRRIAFGVIQFEYKNKANSFLKDAKNKESIEVRYNPYMQSMSVLIPGLNPDSLHLIAAGLLFLFCFIGFVT